MTETLSHKRLIRLVRSPASDGVGVFCIRDAKTQTFYVFHEIPNDIGGRGFALHRLGLGDLYHVRIGTPAQCSCECLGFLRHGNCKHIQGLLALAHAGKL
ncbi:MAG: hypothetical protein E6K70_08465 [Planctomycetota bacterium]|nr:MAG: hypothetical protein E6K70_08465 [Planctomycetota bacterium]